MYYSTGGNCCPQNFQSWQWTTPYCGGGNNSSYAIVLVLFILLVIVIGSRYSGNR